MEQEKPRNYTFVFPRALKKSDHDYWRATFKPWAQEKFGKETPGLDYWADLADRLQDRPDLVDQLSDGAVGGYVRKVLEQTAADGVNPLSTASDHIDTAAKLAERAEQLGEDDPYFAYGGAGRDAHAGDRDIPSDRVRFTMDRSQDDALPRYAVSVRRGNRIHEITAAPREGTVINVPRLIFNDDSDGADLRKSARLRLAKGQQPTLNSPLVRLDPGGGADKFRHLTDDDGALHGGEIDLGLSEPLKLFVTMTTGETTLSEELTMYRIPEEPGDRTAWGGSIGGTVLMFDLRPVRDDSDDVELIFSVMSAFGGESPRQALRGLGFVRAFAEAQSTHFECDGLLKPGGLTIPTVGNPDPHANASLMASGVVAQALTELEARDPRGRTMPAELDQRDAAIAQMVLELCRQGESRDSVNSTSFEVPLPANATPSDDPADWMSWIQALPHIAGRPSVRVQVTIEGARPLKVDTAADGQRILLCSGDGSSAIVLRIHDFS